MHEIKQKSYFLGIFSAFNLRLNENNVGLICKMINFAQLLKLNHNQNFTKLNNKNMIGAIPNPKKSFDIDFDSKGVFEKIQYLPLITKFKFNSKNEVLKTYTFESFEFLSFGVYVDVSISSITEGKTKIEIEIRRKIGAFDKSYEVSEAGRHIVEISEGISKCIVLSAEQIEILQKGIEETQNLKIANSDKKWYKKKRYWVLIILLILLFLASKWSPFYSK